MNLFYLFVWLVLILRPLHYLIPWVFCLSCENAWIVCIWLHSFYSGLFHKHKQSRVFLFLLFLLSLSSLLNVQRMEFVLLHCLTPFSLLAVSVQHNLSVFLFSTIPSFLSLPLSFIWNSLAFLRSVLTQAESKRQNKKVCRLENSLHRILVSMVLFRFGKTSISGGHINPDTE